MTLRRSEVVKVAMLHPGIWDEFIKRGVLDSSGEYLQIGRGDFDAISQKYFPDGGLGTVLHEVLAPVADFLDSFLGTKLGDCGGCAERELQLNR
jgi:hypothetical protein